ncbi:endogenous retrovirus group K member 13-1 Env polyprotein-like [Callospermophilus lateralis]|uniref:endogenous retrovirus group K member 13-1 Env polyprotein-like n=1 Tax=Callospermophilus lateralis TaxID=76772 RepID=UPI004038A4DE
MDTDNGFQGDGSRPVTIRTAPYPSHRPRNQTSDFDIPVAALAQLRLGPRRRRRLNISPLPTWGQIKKLSGEGQKVLQRTGKALTVENLFLAMCALLTVSSSSEVPTNNNNTYYWAYIPDPPLMEPVMWGEMDITLYTSPAILSPPWNNLTYLNIHDGAIYNFTYQNDVRRPICLGSPPCLQLDWQHWILAGSRSNGSRTKLQRLSTWSINMTWDNITEAKYPMFPNCPDFTYNRLQYNPFIWQECGGKFGKIYQGIIMWGPYGMFLKSCSEWNSSTCDLSSTYRIPPKERWNEILTNDKLMAWGDGGVADPPIASIQHPYHIQTHLWKIAAAMKPVVLLNGSFSGTSRSPSSYKFTFFKEYNVTTCVPMPYLFLVGNIIFNSGITCHYCKLYTCINTSVPLAPGHSVMILQQRSHIWLPVNLQRPWSQDPVNTLVMEFFRQLLKRSKRFVGVLVAVILSLIAVTTVATVSGVALHTSLQTKHFVEEWHKDSHNLWLLQKEIDSRLQTQIDILKQTVNWLGKKVLTLEQEIRLKCDWNSTTFCITNVQYNQSLHEWSTIQAYMDGNETASLMINSLQKDIFEVFGKGFQHNDAAQIAEVFLKQLEGLDPKGIIQSLSHTAGGQGKSESLWYLESRGEVATIL